ncbi:NAD(P)-binding domain-containing protein [Streptomyces sp. SAI-229]|uniref:NAD(P)-binding domain-containing protein n=1 Tax=Streptomyces sp. SAI-229 TaxID=3377731 RepID=UPI003C7AA010
MAPGGIILVHSTVSAEYVVRLARDCRSHGVTVLDAPVAGFRRRAVTGQLTVMVGGPAEEFERVRPCRSGRPPRGTGGGVGRHRRGSVADSPPKG